MQVALENVSAEDAAASLAKFSNITGFTMTDVDKLGSCIAGLENNSAALAIHRYSFFVMLPSLPV